MFIPGNDDKKWLMNKVKLLTKQNGIRKHQQGFGFFWFLLKTKSRSMLLDFILQDKSHGCTGTLPQWSDLGSAVSGQSHLWNPLQVTSVSWKFVLQPLLLHHFPVLGGFPLIGFLKTLFPDWDAAWGDVLSVTGVLPPGHLNFPVCIWMSKNRGTMWTIQVGLWVINLHHQQFYFWFG